jgi:hypothetical protein
MKYDPNWLQKEKAKKWAKQDEALTHVQNERDIHMLCGKGFYSGINVVIFCSLTSLSSVQHKVRLRRKRKANKA